MKSARYAKRPEAVCDLNSGRRSDAGAVIVEYVLALTILIPMFFGIINTALFLQTQIELQNEVSRQATAVVNSHGVLPAECSSALNLADANLRAFITAYGSAPAADDVVVGAHVKLTTGLKSQPATFAPRTPIEQMIDDTLDNNIERVTMLDIFARVHPKCVLCDVFGVSSWVIVREQKPLESKNLCYTGYDGPWYSPYDTGANGYKYNI